MHLVYDYYGLLLSFPDEGALPITVYGQRDDLTSAICIRFRNGLMEQHELLPSSHDLDTDDLNTFRLLIEKNSSEIIKKWLDIFLYNRCTEPEIIRQNIREQ